MKIVQSFWSLPAQTFADSDVQNRSAGGWLSERFHLVSWALSCLKLKEFYKNVNLVTDTDGKRLLIDELRLPYTHVSTELDNLRWKYPKAWSLGKIYAYSLQQEPFLHVDGDVFIWKKFPRELECAELVAQNAEYNFGIYKSVLQDFYKVATFIPAEFSPEITDAVNAGIIGGSNFKFYNDFFHKVEAFISRNDKVIACQTTGDINLIFEQYYAKRIADTLGLTFSYLFEEMSSGYQECLQLHLVPHFSTFVHMIGHAKKNWIACTMMEELLRLEYPRHHARIIDFLKAADKVQDEVWQGRFRSNLIKWRKCGDVFATKFVIDKSAAIKDDQIHFVEPLTRLSKAMRLDDLDQVLTLLDQPQNILQLFSLIEGSTDLEQHEQQSLRIKLVKILVGHVFYHGTVNICE